MHLRKQLIGGNYASAKSAHRRKLCVCKNSSSAKIMRLRKQQNPRSDIFQPLTAEDTNEITKIPI